MATYLCRDDLRSGLTLFSMALRPLPRDGRVAEIARRDGCSCAWCGRVLDTGSPAATLEHVIPKLKGGPAWIENEVIACRACNHSRGHTSPADWMRLCLERGARPSLNVVRARLHELDAAIKTRGGVRRARAYLEGQIKRFAKWFPQVGNDPPVSG